MPDFETLTEPENCEENNGDKSEAERDDLSIMCTDMIGHINIKIGIFLFIFGIFIFSDLFIENILTKIDGAVSADTATTKGTVVQLIIIVLFYLIIDIFNQARII